MPLRSPSRLVWLLLTIAALAGTFAAAVSFTEAANQRDARAQNVEQTNRLLREVRDLGEANNGVLARINRATSPEAQESQRKVIDEAVRSIVDQVDARIAARLSCPR